MKNKIIAPKKATKLTTKQQSRLMAMCHVLFPEHHFEIQVNRQGKEVDIRWWHKTDSSKPQVNHWYEFSRTSIIPAMGTDVFRDEEVFGFPNPDVLIDRLWDVGVRNKLFNGSKQQQ